jgi:hypothetical protein
MSNGQDGQMGYYAVVHNIRQGLAAGRKLANLGYAPLVPHMDHFNALFQEPSAYEESLEIDDAWLVKADALLRLPGPSKGADAEVMLATKQNIPVFTSIDRLDDYFNGGWNAIHRGGETQTPGPAYCAVGESVDEQGGMQLRDYPYHLRPVTTG